MEKELRLLLIEDNEDDAHLLVHLLEKEGYQTSFLRIQNEAELNKALDSQNWDLIICDYRLPSFTGSEALEIFKQKGLEIPFILLSGTVGEEIAVNMMKAGAHDYIMKDHIGRLGPAIKRELSEAELRRQRKDILEELRIAKEQAEQSDKLKSNLLASLSHEFRTPLNGILGFAQVIESESEAPYIQKNAQNIYGAGQRLMKTLDSIMWLAQLNSGLQPKFSFFNLEKFLTELLIPFREKALEKNLALNIQVEPGLSCYSDQQLLGESLINLVDNAIKYTGEGSIEIRVELTGEFPSAFLEVTVKDTGIGINPENFTIIFDAFRQVSEGMGRKFEGCGLGLTIVKKIIEILGGDINIKSHVNSGSAFTIRLPFRKNPDSTWLTPQDTAATEPVLLPDIKNKYDGMPHVLVVEDNELNKELLLVYLKTICMTDHAPDAETAIQKVKEKQYKAILMDINLGEGMDGLEATEIIRTIAGYEKIPIIAVTGYTLYGDQERILARGCSHYLPKPFSRDNLTRLISSVIN